MRMWLKKLRDERNMTQQQIANDMSMTQQYYHLIENGDRQQDMGLSIMEGLSNVLNVPIQIIIDAEKDYIANLKI